MMKKIFFGLALIILLILPGCWDYTEYDNMVQVIAMGVDFNKESKETTVTIQYIPTTKQKGGSSGDSKGSVQQDGVVHTATDQTLYGALTKLREKVNKEIFLGYLKVIIIGNEAAKYKMRDLMDLYDRMPSIRSNVYLAISSGQAADTLSTLGVDHIAPAGTQIYNLINLTKNSGTAYSVSIHDFIEMLAVPGMEVTAPRVITEQLKQKSDDKSDKKPEGIQKVSGIAVFKGDRLVGWLDEKESSGFRWITGKDTHAYKESLISGSADTADILYYQIKKSKNKIKVQMQDGQPVIKVDVSVNAELRKYYSNKGSEIFSPKDIRDMEKKLSDSIQADMEASLEKCQTELKSDIFGFGFAFFRQYPKLWQTEYGKKWDNIFPNLNVNVKVNAKVEDTGENNRKLQIK